MIAHTNIPISNYKKTKKFYSTVLATLSYTRNMEYNKATGFNNNKNTDFWIATNEKDIIPLHVTFETKNKTQIKAFYKAALATGATNNGAPRYHKEY